MARRKSRRTRSRRGNMGALKKIHDCQRKMGGKGLTLKQFHKAVSNCASK